jgi:hypothetical protein
MPIQPVSFTSRANKSTQLEGKEFWAKHPDLAPRNVYLSEGRVMGLNEVEKGLNDICKESFSKRCMNVIKKITSLLIKR